MLRKTMDRRAALRWDWTLLLGIWEVLQIEATSAERNLRAEACEAVANGDRSLLDGHADAALRHYDEATPVAADRL